MLPVNFNVVLTGENFPVHSIVVSDFEFNHRGLRETVRFPMGLNAETRGASLQVLPDRLQASVSEVRDITTDADNLVRMVQPIFEYIGPKSFVAVGHNAQFLLNPAIPKSAVANSILNQSSVAQILGTDTELADINIYQRMSNGALLRASLLTQTPVDQVAVEFNVHFDAKSLNARDAVNDLGKSLARMVEIAVRTESSLQDQKVAPS